MTQFIAACIQLNSQADMDANLRSIETYMRQAALAGATFIALPENALFMQEPGKGTPPDPTAAIARLSALAQALKIWLLVGSVQTPAPGGKSFNRSLLISDTGTVIAQYDKIHLFDVTLKNGETYRESDRIVPGAEAILAPTPFGTLGMSVCYDLRFPQLYRTLSKAGADFLSIPSAFTHTTGSAHWHALLRARAIENGCYVLAPAQCGTHPGNRRTYGHSLIVNPWGEIIAEASEAAPGFITASIDTGRIGEARAMIPALTHDRNFKINSH